MNTASLEDLQTTLDVATPIAERIVESRPHYSLEDALIVAGIGPGRMSQLIAAVDACATLTLPPPIPADVCESDEQIDLQTASVDEIADVFASEPVAESLVEWRALHPFPTLEHATIISGVGDGRLKKLAGDLCITPAPFEAVDDDGNSVAYRWVYASIGAEVDIEGSRGNYSLAVPPGAITDPVGAWASVTVLPDISETADWPRMDAHIEGPWIGEVEVGLPRDTFQWDGLGLPTVPAVYHETVDGTELITPDHGLTFTANMVSTPLTSLSTVETIETPWYNRFYDVIDWAGGTAISPPDCSPSAVARVSIEGGMVDPGIAGGPLFGACSLFSASDAVVKLRNRSTVIFDRTLVLANPASAVDLSEVGGSDIIAEIVAFGPAVAPEGELHVRLSPASPVVSVNHATWPSTVASVNFSASQLRTSVAIALDVTVGEIFDWMGDLFPDGSAIEFVFDDETYELAECAWTASNSHLAGLVPALGSCLPDSYDDLIEAIGQFGGEATRTYALRATERWKASIEAITSTVNTGQDILKAGTVAVDLIGTLQLPNGLVFMEYAAAKPTSYGGFPVGSHCLSIFNDAGWRLDLQCQSEWVEELTNPGGDPGSGVTTDLGPGELVREANGDEWFFDYLTGLYHPLAPGVFECLSYRYPVDELGIILGMVEGDSIDECTTGEYLLPEPGVGTVAEDINGNLWLLAGNERTYVEPDDKWCAVNYYADSYRENVPGALLDAYEPAPESFTCISVN